MKKLIVALSTIFCAFLIAVSIYTLLPQNNPPSARSAAEQQYIVADWGGKVAVFEEGADGKKLYLIPHRTYHEEEFTVRGEEGEPQNLPETAVSYQG